MLSLLVCGYATGLFSSRKIKRVTVTEMPFATMLPAFTSSRGLQKEVGEWTLAYLAWNLKCMAILQPSIPVKQVEIKTVSKQICLCKSRRPPGVDQPVGMKKLGKEQMSFPLSKQI